MSSLCGSCEKRAELYCTAQCAQIGGSSKYFRVEPTAADKLNNDFLLAVENGNIQVVRKLLADPRVDPTDNAIAVAAENGRIQVLKLLLDDPRFNPAADDNYALEEAVNAGQTEAARLLLADPRVERSLNPKLRALVFKKVISPWLGGDDLKNLRSRK